VGCFAFVLHSFADTDTKKIIDIHYLIIPTPDLVRIAEQKKPRKNDIYHFFIWLDTERNLAFDFKNPGPDIDLSEYLDDWDRILE
jgi:hypothetical protein